MFWVVDLKNAVRFYFVRSRFPAVMCPLEENELNVEVVVIIATAIECYINASAYLFVRSVNNKLIYVLKLSNLSQNSRLNGSRELLQWVSRSSLSLIKHQYSLLAWPTQIPFYFPSVSLTSWWNRPRCVSFWSSKLSGKWSRSVNLNRVNN